MRRMLPLAAPEASAGAPDAGWWRGRGQSVLQHAVAVFALCLAIAVLLTVLERGRGFGVKLVYSTCIGLACWALIDGPRLALAWWRQHRGRPVPRHGLAAKAELALLAALAAFVGPMAGLALGDALTGVRSPVAWDFGAPATQLTFTLAVIGTLAATAAGVLLERAASARAEAEAARRLASETQLKLLRSQLEPHMLFNTLANLRVLIGVDAAQAQAMLDRLIGFLRTTLAASQAQEHTLAREFAWIGDYLALMAVRMGPRLAVQLELPDALADRPVPPLLLQPLVENAIHHGLEPQAAPGRVEVRARREGDRLVLTVRDTGRGLPARPARDGGGFGLAQVRERLRALHGERASLVLQAAPDAEGGALATITLPA